MTKDLACPFCEIAESGYHERIQDKNEYGFVIRDGFPVTDGHSRFNPKQHIQSFFESTDIECAALLTLLDSATVQLDSGYTPSANNMGINRLACCFTDYASFAHSIDSFIAVEWVVPENYDNLNML